MSSHQFTALIPVTSVADTPGKAREYARSVLDDTLARMDDEHPTGALSTGPAMLVDLPSVLRLVQLIRDDAHALATGAAQTRGVPAHRIRQRAEQILAALTSEPGEQPAPRSTER